MRIELKGKVERTSGFSLDLDLSCDIEGVVAVVGPSGAGKSTLLRVIAGFERESKHRLEVDGVVWDGPPHSRAVSTVFQEPRLFPHLSVAQNLAFARRGASDGISLALDRIVEMLDLEPLLGRSIHELSGGQQQRVALGRAMARPAKLWLFDEPMSALDPRARLEIAPYLTRLCREHRVPIVYVTHALGEILQLAGQVMVIDDGRITSIDSLTQFSTQFDNPLLHDDQTGAVVECEFRAFDRAHGLSELAFGDAMLRVQGDLSGYPTPLRLVIPARDVSIATQPVHHVSILNRVSGVIDALDHQQSSVLVRVLVGNQALLARVTELSREELGLTPGVPVQALIKSIALKVLDD